SDVDKAVRQAVGNCVALNATGLRIETIETDTRADINSTPFIFGNAGNLIGGESFLHSVMDKAWAICGRIIDACQAALGACDPQSSQMIAIQRSNHPGGHA